MKQDRKIYRNVPRVFTSPFNEPGQRPRSQIELRLLDRRRRRLEVAHAADPNPPLFSAALSRAIPRGAARGLAKAITKYSALFVFSKKARILAGKR